MYSPISKDLRANIPGIIRKALSLNPTETNGAMGERQLSAEKLNDADRRRTSA
jgi:hypothetical protein